MPVHPERGYNREALANLLGLYPFQVDQARASGLLSQPSDNGYWSFSQAGAARRQRTAIAEQHGDRNDADGDHTADRIKLLFPYLDISPDTLAVLHADGTLPGTAAGRLGNIYRTSGVNDLLARADAEAVIMDAAARGELLSSSEAAARLEVVEKVFRTAAARNGIEPTRQRRSLRRRMFCGPLFLRSEVDRLASDPDVIKARESPWRSARGPYRRAGDSDTLPLVPVSPRAAQDRP